MANLEDVQDLIQEILDNPKLKHVADRLRQEYHDEPILQTASQMQRLLPRPLVEAKRLMRNPAEYHYNYKQLFYQQAKLLEDFTDDFSEQASFSSCYPCYRDMNDRQLRTYFTWRTKVRQGIVESTSPSYAELYCYELLHQIGVPDPETGFRMLQQFRQDYTAVSPECRFPYFSIWLHDYIIYYGLDQALLPELSEDYAAEARFDKSFQTVQEAETHTDAELFQAISDLSGYGLQRSKFYREQTELIEQAVPYARCATTSGTGKRATIWNTCSEKRGCSPTTCSTMPRFLKPIRRETATMFYRRIIFTAAATASGHAKPISMRKRERNGWAVLSRPLTRSCGSWCSIPTP